MRTTRRTVAAALLTALCLIPLASCGTAQTSDDGTIHVVASVNQWGSLASELGGDDVTVTSILGSTSVDAHDFEPKTADIAAISRASIVVTNGAGYDTWAEKSVTSGATHINAADAVHATAESNAHLWFSKDARTAVAQQLTEAFIAAQPEHQTTFEELHEQWEAREQQLDKTIADVAKNHQGKTYAATESVATYLMEELGFKDVTPEGYAHAAASEGESAPADLKEFQTMLADGKVDVFVVNPQETSDTADLLTASAKSGDTPVVPVTEQMPEILSTLTDWMTSLVESIEAVLES